MRKLYLHCGLHKTGTTALQTVFMQNAEALAKHGVLYPKAGQAEIYGTGHKNIAWQVQKIPQFRKKFGKFDDLMDEIGAFGGTTVISTEDFETALYQPVPLAGFLRQLAKRNIDVTLVVYLRDQLSYCESLFSQHARQMFFAEYEDYVNQAITNGVIVKHWAKFIFDYERIVETAKQAGAKLILRNFHALPNRSVVRDFLGVIGLEEDVLLDSLDKRANSQTNLAYLISRFYKSFERRPLNDAERDCIRLLCKVLGDSMIVTSPATRAAFLAKFQAANIRICEAHGLPTTGLDFASLKPDAVPDSAIFLERLYAAETNNLISRMSKTYDPGKRLPLIEMAQAHRDNVLRQNLPIGLSVAAS